ncbi:MAG: NAD-glutamate dehydrogenase [Actinomycetota bacterium]|nr:NAD-glutamate dehydrogenase [Actinomycetota bacterium]
MNIKILLDSVVGSGDMTEKQRNELLFEMTEEVAGHVLRNNYLQTQAISEAVSQASSMADVHARYIRALEQAGKLDRNLEFLPSEEELADRKSQGMGLTAPEFAVLLAYTKNTLHNELLNSDLPEDPYLSKELELYFPKPLRERLGDRMEEHRLRQQITATQLANGMVNRCGITFAYRMRDETGAAAPEIARAYTVARDVFGMLDLWKEIEALDNVVDAGVQIRMLLDARRLVERATRWLLRNRRPPLDIAATTSYFSQGAKELVERIPELMLDSDRETLMRATKKLVEENVPPDLAKRVATLNSTFSALDVVDVASATDKPLEAAAAVYFTLGDRLKLHWLRQHIEALPRDNRWRTLARAALRDDLYNQQATLTREILKSVPEGLPASDRIDAWIEANRGAAERTMQVLRDINSSGTFDLSTLPVALREIRNLITSSEGVSEASEVEVPAR